MNRIIKLYDLLGAEIRSRSSADVLHEMLSDANVLLTVDLSGISFISRSFADELCCMAESKDIKLCNADGIVENMLSVVSDSRKQKRIRTMECTEIKEIKDMESLSAFLATI